MGRYSYIDTSTGDEVELDMTIAEMEEFERTAVTFKRVLKPVAFGDSVRLGVTRSPDSFNDLLKTIRKRNKHSNISVGNGEV